LTDDRIDVLIAEDEPSILESLSFILRRAGLNCATVTDGDAALEAVRRLAPRVLVLDVMLPRRSGFDVLKRVRSDPHTAQLPVMILTAKGPAAGPPHRRGSRGRLLRDQTLCQRGGGGGGEAAARGAGGIGHGADGDVSPLPSPSPDSCRQSRPDHPDRPGDDKGA
jgi:CheY-like chemotaxis protein